MKRGGGKAGKGTKETPSLFDEIEEGIEAEATVEIGGVEIDILNIPIEKNTPEKAEEEKPLPLEAKRKRTQGATEIEKSQGYKISGRRESPEPLNTYPIPAISGKMVGGEDKGFFAEFRSNTRAIHSLSLQYLQTCVSTKIKHGQIMREIHPLVVDFARRYDIDMSKPNMVLDVYKEQMFRKKMVEVLKQNNIVIVPFSLLVDNFNESVAARRIGKREEEWHGEVERGGDQEKNRIGDIVTFIKNTQDAGGFVYEVPTVDEDDPDENGMPSIKREAARVKLIPKIIFKTSKAAPSNFDIAGMLGDGEGFPEHIRKEWIEEVQFHYDPEFFAPMVGVGENSIILHTENATKFSKGFTWRLAQLVEIMAEEGCKSLRRTSVFEKVFDYDYLENFFRAKFSKRSRIISKILVEATKEYNQKNEEGEGYTVEVVPEKKEKGRGYIGARIKISLNFPNKFFTRPYFSFFDYVAAKIHFTETPSKDTERKIKETREILKSTFPEHEIYGMGSFVLDEEALERLGISCENNFEPKTFADLQDEFHFELNAYRKIRQHLVIKYRWFEANNYEICDTCLNIIDRKTHRVVKFSENKEGGGFADALGYFYMSLYNKVPANYVNQCPEIIGGKVEKK